MLYWVLRGTLKPLCRALYRIRVEGLENLPPEGPLIIAANHLSFLDSVFIPISVPRRKVTYLAKADYFNNPRTRWFFRLAGQIPTERDGGEKSQQALAVALDLLASGGSLGIYPEGTRSPDGFVHRGRTGVARLAISAGTPVVPVGISGTDEIMPKAARLPRVTGRPEARIRFGAPLDLSRHSGREQDRGVLREATDEIMQRITELSGLEYKDEYAATGPAGPPGRTGPAGEDDDGFSDDALTG